MAKSNLRLKYENRVRRSTKSHVTQPLLGATQAGDIAQSRGNLTLYALCGVIAPIFFAVMVIIEGFLEPGYSQVSQYISDLGAYALYGSYAILQNLNFWIFGILVVVFSFGLKRSLPGTRATNLLVLFGIMVFLGGVFPDSPSPFPGYIHDTAAVAGFISIVLCQFVVWRRLRHNTPEEEKVWGGYRSYSLASGLLSLVLFIYSSFILPFDSPITGLVQRVFVAVPFLWIEVMAIRLLRPSGLLPAKKP